MCDGSELWPYSVSYYRPSRHPLAWMKMLCGGELLRVSFLAWHRCDLVQRYPVAVPCNNQVLPSLTHLLLCLQGFISPWLGRVAISHCHCLDVCSLAIVHGSWMCGQAGPWSSKPLVAACSPWREQLGGVSALGTVIQAATEVMWSLGNILSHFPSSCILCSMFHILFVVRQARGERNSLCIVKERGGGVAWMGL